MYRLASAIALALALSVASLAAAGTAEAGPKRHNCKVGKHCCHWHVWPKNPAKNFMHCHRYPGHHKH